MTTPRKRTPKKVQQELEVTTETLTTYSVQVETDASALYPPVPASQAVGFGERISLTKEVEIPTWKKNLHYVPIVVGALLVTIAILAVGA